MAQATTRKQDEGEARTKSYQRVRAPRGSRLICQGWEQEAALRMLMNSLDEEVAEQPRELIACGPKGKVLRDWDCYHATVSTLKGLKADETLLVHFGKPVGVFETHEEAPRILITSRQPAAGSWTYVGSQGTLPVAFQTLDAVSQKHFGGNLAGKLVVSGGMGSAGGALSLAAGLVGAAFLGIEVEGEKIRRRIRAGYCDYCVNTLDEALRILKNAVRQKQAVSVGLVGNCADLIPELVRRGVVPDILTDQTGANDLLSGYVPSSVRLQEVATLRSQNRQEYLTRVRNSIARHVDGMLALQKSGSFVFVFGNGIQAAAREDGSVKDGFAFPDFFADCLAPLLREGMVPVQWVALSGDQGDIRQLDDLALNLFPDDAMLARWIPLARRYVRFQGLPARAYWLGPEARIALAERVNDLVANGTLTAPVVIALEQWNCGSVDSDSSALEGGRRDDWAIPTALLNTASGASLASLTSADDHFSSTSLAVVADGTPKSAKRLSRVMRNDSRLSKIGLPDAGHDTIQKTPRHTKPWISPSDMP